MPYFIIGIFVAIVCGSIIGLERELTGHKGSIKVDVLICLGSFTFCMTEVFFADTAFRISANIVTGVGFLCSGFIFKDGLNVNGLSTAATLWCSAGVGILTAKGRFLESLIISVFLFALNLIFSKVSDAIKPLKAFDDNKKDVSFVYNIVCMENSVSEVKTIIEDNVRNDDSLYLKKLNVNEIAPGKKRVTAKVKVDNYDIEKLNKVLEEIGEIDGILNSGWEQKDESSKE